MTLYQINPENKEPIQGAGGGATKEDEEDDEEKKKRKNA